MRLVTRTGSERGHSSEHRAYRRHSGSMKWTPLLGHLTAEGHEAWRGPVSCSGHHRKGGLKLLTFPVRLLQSPDPRSLGLSALEPRQGQSHGYGPLWLCHLLSSHSELETRAAWGVAVRPELCFRKILPENRDRCAMGCSRICTRELPMPGCPAVQRELYSSFTPLFRLDICLEVSMYFKWYRRELAA